MGEIIKLLASKNTDDLFNKVKELLAKVGVTVYNKDGSVKDLYTVLDEAAKALHIEE